MTKKKFVNTTESTNNSENFNNPISSETACSKTFLREIDDQQFTKTALFHTPTSLLTKIDLKSLFQPSIFESFPRHSQLKLIKLLPECDRQLDSHGSFKLNSGALNNEFIKKCCSEWQQKLLNGDFGSFNINSIQNNAEIGDGASLLNSTTTITRSTRLRQQKLLQSLKANDSGDEEEFFYYDEEDSLDTYTPNPSQQIRKSHTIPTEKQLDKHKQDDAESIHSLYASAANSGSSSPAESSITDGEDSDDYVYEALDENLTDDTDSKSISSLVEEDLENKKRLLHRQAKQLLRKNKKLRKNYALTSENIITVKSTTKNSISQTLEDKDMWQVNNQTPVRKSLRTRKTVRKFVDKEYAFDDEMSDTSSESSEIALKARVKIEDEPKKGELKLRIKRITTIPVILNTSDTPDNTASLNSTKNTSLSYTLSIDPSQQLSVKVPLISPDARITRRTAAILKSSPTIRTADSKPSVTTLAASALSNLDDLYDTQESFVSGEPLNSENNNVNSDEEVLKKNTQIEIPSTVKTLAQIRDQILKKKKKRTSDEFINSDFKDDENDLTNDSDYVEDKTCVNNIRKFSPLNTIDTSDSIKRFKFSTFRDSSDELKATESITPSSSCIADTYTSNINKIVHELKSIGNSQETPSPISVNDTTVNRPLQETNSNNQSKKDRIENLHFLNRLFANKRKMRSLFSFKPTKLSTFISALVKQQQYLLLNSSINDPAIDRLNIDTSIINKNFINCDDDDLHTDNSEAQSDRENEMRLLKLPSIANLINVPNNSRTLNKNIDLLKKNMRKLKQQENTQHQHQTVSSATIQSNKTVSNGFNSSMLMNDQMLLNNKVTNLVPSQHQQLQFQQINNKPVIKRDEFPCIPNFDFEQSNNKVPKANKELIPTLNGYQNKPYTNARNHLHQQQQQQFFSSNSYSAPHLQCQQTYNKIPKLPIPDYPIINQHYNNNTNHQPQINHQTQQLYAPNSAGDMTYENYTSQQQQNLQHIQEYSKNNNYQSSSFQQSQVHTQASSEKLMRPLQNNMFSSQPQPHQHSHIHQHNQQHNHTHLSGLSVNENLNIINNSNATHFGHMQAAISDCSGNITSSVDSITNNYDTGRSNSINNEISNGEGDAISKMFSLNSTVNNSSTSISPNQSRNVKPKKKDSTTLQSSKTLINSQQPQLSPPQPSQPALTQSNPPESVNLNQQPSSPVNQNQTSGKSTSPITAGPSNLPKSQRSTQHQLTVAQLLSKNRQKAASSAQVTPAENLVQSKSDLETATKTATLSEKSILSSTTTDNTRKSPDLVMPPPRSLSSSPFQEAGKNFNSNRDLQNSSPSPPVLKLTMQTSEIETITSNKLSASNSSNSSASSSPVTFSEIKAVTSLLPKITKMNRNPSPTLAVKPAFTNFSPSSSFKPVQTNINLGNTLSTGSASASSATTSNLLNTTFFVRNVTMNSSAPTKFKQICTPFINLNQEKKNSIVLTSNSNSNGSLGLLSEAKSETDEISNPAKFAKINEEMRCESGKSNSEISEHARNDELTKNGNSADKTGENSQIINGTNIKFDPTADSDQLQNYPLSKISTDQKDLSETKFNMPLASLTTPVPLMQGPNLPSGINISGNVEVLSESMKLKKENIIGIQVPKKNHECNNGSHQAMVECQVCTLFCHADCVSTVGDEKMCGLCKKKRSAGNETNEVDGKDEDENNGNDELHYKDFN